MATNGELEDTGVTAGAGIGRGRLSLPRARARDRARAIVGKPDALPELLPIGPCEGDPCSVGEDGRGLSIRRVPLTPVDLHDAWTAGRLPLPIVRDALAASWLMHGFGPGSDAATISLTDHTGPVIVGLELPDSLTVYRGECEGDALGASWTLSPIVAWTYATDAAFHPGRAVVRIAKVDRADVCLATPFGRGHIVARRVDLISNAYNATPFDEPPEWWPTSLDLAATWRPLAAGYEAAERHLIGHSDPLPVDWDWRVSEWHSWREMGGWPWL